MILHIFTRILHHLRVYYDFTKSPAPHFCIHQLLNVTLLSLARVSYKGLRTGMNLPSRTSGTGFPGMSSLTILLLLSSFPSQHLHGNTTVSPCLLVTVTSSTNMVLPRPEPSSPIRSLVIYTQTEGKRQNYRLVSCLDVLLKSPKQC